MGLADLPPQVLATFGGIFAFLLLATGTHQLLKRSRPEADFSELGARIRTWWMMVTVFTLALLLSRIVSIVFFAFLSFLALKEYFSLTPQRRADRRVLFWAYLAIPVQFYWVGIEWYPMFIIFIPVYMFLLLPMRMVLIGETQGFLRAVSMIHWGLMTTVFCVSHLAYLLVLPPLAPGALAPGAGLVLYLVMLTQLNDVMQYVWGKMLGRHKVIPKVSPGKTWEGLIGGVLTTVVLAVVLGSWLTPFPTVWLMLGAGLLIGLSGFIGDVTISALKRDLGIKDSGTLLPGHGGILDRIDSLIYTAPLFFHYTYYFVVPMKL